ncbi:hypothetical protein TNCV_1666401 [Trichonephila clavipes]|nr:hypothetical protein TNCV_1666401 [Trichonephila clavipes]
MQDDFAPFRPNFNGEHLGADSVPLFPFHQLRELNGYLEYPHAAKELYIYEHPCLLRAGWTSLKIILMLMDLHSIV